MSASLREKLTACCVTSNATEKPEEVVVTTGKGNLSYEVILTKGEQSKIGIDIAHHPSAENGVSLRVKSISLRGLVMDWNDKNPDKEIKEGDLIMKCNAVSGNSKDILTELQEKTQVRLLMERPSNLWKTPSIILSEAGIQRES